MLWKGREYNIVIPLNLTMPNVVPAEGRLSEIGTVIFGMSR